MHQFKKSKIIIPLYLKIAAPFALYFIIFISLISFFSIKNAINQTKKEITEIAESDAKNKIAFTKLEANTVYKDTYFLVHIAEMQNYLNASDFNEKIKALNDLKQSLFHFGYTRKNDYNQIRILNSRGVEIIKINNTDNAISLAEENDLKNESAKYYTKEALALQSNQVYISQIDLANTAENKGNLPIIPVIRTAIKIFDKNETSFVILMLDFRADAIVSQAGMLGEKEEEIKEEHMDMLLNKDGYYLAYKGDTSKEWGMLTGNGDANIKKDSPDLADTILNQEKGHIIDEKTGDMIYFESKPLKEFLGFDQKNEVGGYQITGPDEKIIFSEITKSSAIINVIKPLRNNIITEGLTAFFIGAILIFIISSLITKPLQKLTLASAKLAKGDWDVDIKIETADEIEALAGSFQNMAIALKESYQSLENKIEDRTMELNQEKNRLKKIIDTLPVGVIIASAPIGKITLTNAKGLELLGKYEKAPTLEYYAKTYNLSKPDGSPYPDSELPSYIALKEGKASLKDDVIVKRPKGGSIQLLVSSVPIFNDKGIIVESVTAFEDITKLKDVDRLKTEFISIVSHQLKTPIGSLEWLAEMLLANDAGKLNSKQRSMVSDIYSTSERIAQLVNDLLNISRLEMGKIIPEIKIFNISSLLKEVKQELSAIYTPKKQKISIAIEKNLPKLKTDSKLLREVLANLFSNAVKYTPNGGNINISAKKDGENLLFAIQDTGIGIPQSEQSKMFNKFFRAENAKEMHIEGTGLGLYAVKSMIETLGGKIWFESEEDIGTTFYFTIPII